MSPAFRAIRGANLLRCECVPYLPEYVCNIWLRSDGRVERKGGYRHIAVTAGMNGYRITSMVVAPPSG